MQHAAEIGRQALALLRMLKSRPQYTIWFGAHWEGRQNMMGVGVGMGVKRHDAQTIGNPLAQPNYRGQRYLAQILKVLSTKAAGPGTRQLGPVLGTRGYATTTGWWAVVGRVWGAGQGRDLTLRQFWLYFIVRPTAAAPSPRQDAATAARPGERRADQELSSAAADAKMLSSCMNCHILVP